MIPHRNTPPAQRPGARPRHAAAFSLLVPGLGHVYCGQLRKGLALMVAATGLVLAFLPPIALDVPSKGSLLACAAVMTLALCAYATVDAVRTAKRALAFVPQVFNHWTVYTSLFLLGGIGPLASVLVVRDKCLQPFRIPTSSMEPTLLPGDRALAMKDRYRHRDPTRGELVVYANPKDRAQMYVKRVVALAGDTVEVRQGRLHLNGQPLPLEAVAGSQAEFKETNGAAAYRIQIRTDGQAPEDFGPMVVAPDHVFVLGDNRNHSRDSRQMGALATGSLEGRMSFIYWPAQSWTRFGEIR